MSLSSTPFSRDISLGVDEHLCPYTCVRTIRVHILAAKLLKIIYVCKFFYRKSTFFYILQQKRDFRDESLSFLYRFFR